MARQKKPEPVVDDSKRWLDSYADAMTLLLAFFIMLFAFSLVDKDKFIEFKFGVAQALGKPNPAMEGGLGLLDRGNGLADYVAAAPTASGDGAGDGENTPTPTPPDEANDFTGEVTRDEVGQVGQEVQRQLEAVGVGDSVEVRVDPRGLIIHLEDHVLFDSGSALIRPAGLPVLDAVGTVLAKVDNQIVVEGHTDDIPTRGVRWPSNWELSTGRATSVLRYLLEQGDVPAVRLSAAGYADTRPLASNTEERGRSRNRRVELVMIVPTQPADAPVANPPLGVIPDVGPNVQPQPPEIVDGTGPDDVAVSPGFG